MESRIDSSQIIDALISYAARDGLGEDIAWSDVEHMIWALRESPVTASNLRKRMAQLNDPEVALTLADWFERAAHRCDKDASDAARPSDKILGPLQTVTLGSAATAGVLTVTGAISLSASLVVVPFFLLAASIATFGRYHLSQREDFSKQAAKTMRDWAKIAQDRGKQR